MQALSPLVLTLSLFSACAALPRVLVTGAAGRTGSLVYLQAKSDPRIGEVRALVHNISKAKAVLKCDKCDESEGIYIGDVTDTKTMLDAARGMDTLAIASAVSGSAPTAVQKAVEFHGVENQVAALTQATNETSSALRVVLCSSAGTTNPKPPPFEGGKVLFWKLNAEAFLGSAGIGSTIVKPCGLGDGPPGKHALGTGHDDHFPGILSFTIARSDVAAVMIEAIVQRSQGLRFVLCNGPGKPGTDLAKLLEGARYPWQRSQSDAGE